mmetsp:Transcript_24941/g.49604  ORF Transcript_24941/g.49604 Transcript_24941/m.49604 type:complete len:220 (-) Transcript_24941:133-792(-)
MRFLFHLSSYTHLRIPHFINIVITAKRKKPQSAFVIGFNLNEQIVFFPCFYCKQFTLLQKGLSNATFLKTRPYADDPHNRAWFQPFHRIIRWFQRKTHFYHPDGFVKWYILRLSGPSIIFFCKIQTILFATHFPRIPNIPVICMLFRQTPPHQIPSRSFNSALDILLERSFVRYCAGGRRIERVDNKCCELPPVIVRSGWCDEKRSCEGKKEHVKRRTD